MGEGYRITRILVDHFFRRFFDNDTLQVDGDTQTTVVRALAIVAAPGLMIAFFLQILYPAKPFQRPPWLVIEDHYFFVLFSFVVMGAVSIFEWEMLFPDRIDFLVLSPLSLKPVQMLAAKAAASFTSSARQWRAIIATRCTWRCTAELGWRWQWRVQRRSLHRVDIFTAHFPIAVCMRSCRCCCSG
jgi:hypothetical protein